MMVYDKKPLSHSEFAKMQIQEYTNNENSLLKEDAKNRSQNVMNESRQAILNEQTKAKVRNSNFINFSTTVKKVLLSECIYDLYKNVLESALVTDNDKVIAKNLVNKFIDEHGVDNLLRDFKIKNILLSEYNRIVTKYHKAILEASDKSNEDTFDIDPNIKDNFFDELQMINPDEAISNIRNRVADAVQQFIDGNIENKMDIKDILQSVKEKIDAAKIDGVKESYSTLGKRAVLAVKQKPKNVFWSMVHIMSENVMKNEELKKHYTTENGLNMDSIVENTKTMYTFLEILNYTNMVKVNESYIGKILNDLKA